MFNILKVVNINLYIVNDTIYLDKWTNNYFQKYLVNIL